MKIQNYFKQKPIYLNQMILWIIIITYSFADSSKIILNLDTYFKQGTNRELFEEEKNIFKYLNYKKENGNPREIDENIFNECINYDYIISYYNNNKINIIIYNF